MAEQTPDLIKARPVPRPRRGGGARARARPGARPCARPPAGGLAGRQTSVVIALDTEGWDPAVFKIVDVTAGRQVVRTRAAYRTALGEPTPGLHEGDTLTLTARLPITLPLREIRVDGRPAGASSVAAITDTDTDTDIDTDTEGSGWAVLRGLSRVVAAADLAAPEVTVTVTAVGADDRTASVSLGVPIRPGADER